MAKDKPCPRCGNTVEIFTAVRCSTLAVGGVKCRRCGKGKYLMTFCINGWYIDNRQMKERMLRLKWNAKK